MVNPWTEARAEKKTRVEKNSFNRCVLREGRGRGGGGGSTHLLLALVTWPLTTHPFRDGTPFIPTPTRDASNIWALIFFFPCYE